MKRKTYFFKSGGWPDLLMVMKKWKWKCRKLNFTPKNPNLSLEVLTSEFEEGNEVIVDP